MSATNSRRIWVGNNSRAQAAARHMRCVVYNTERKVDFQKSQLRLAPVKPPMAEKKVSEERPPVPVDLGNLVSVPAETKIILAKFLKEAGIFPADDKADVLKDKLIKAGCKVSLSADKRVVATRPPGDGFPAGISVSGTPQQFSVFVFRYNT